MSARLAPILLTTCMHLNSVGIEELRQVFPGLSEHKRQAILHYRSQYDGFKSIYEFEFIPGFGPRFVDKYMSEIRDKFCL